MESGATVRNALESGCGHALEPRQDGQGVPEADEPHGPYHLKSIRSEHLDPDAPALSLGLAANLCENQ